MNVHEVVPPAVADHELRGVGVPRQRQRRVRRAEADVFQPERHGGGARFEPARAIRTDTMSSAKDVGCFVVLVLADDLSERHGPVSGLAGFFARSGHGDAARMRAGRVDREGDRAGRSRDAPAADPHVIRVRGRAREVVYRHAPPRRERDERVHRRKVLELHDAQRQLTTVVVVVVVVVVEVLEGRVVDDIVVHHVRDGVDAHARAELAAGVRHPADHSARHDRALVVSEVESRSARGDAHGGEASGAGLARRRKERGDVRGRHRAERVSPHRGGRRVLRSAAVNFKRC